MILRWVLFALGLAPACVSVDTYYEVHVAAVDQGALVTARGFSMSFNPQAGQLNFPDGMLLRDNGVIGTTYSMPSQESQIGYSVFPLARVSGDSSEILVTRSKLAITLPGPFIVQTSIDWLINLPCGTTMRTKGLQGKTVYTFYPDGRVVRSDVDIKIDSISAGECVADTQKLFWSSYATFDNFMEFRVNGTGYPISAAGPGIGIPFTGTACLTGPNGAVASRSAGDGLQQRMHNPTMMGGAIAFVTDFSNGYLIDGTNNRNLSTTMRFSQVADGPGDCLSLVSAIDKETVQGAPTVNFNGTDTPIGRNGMYEFTAATSTAVTFYPTNGPTLPSGWAVAVKIPGAESISVSGMFDNSKPEAYTVQPDPDDPNRFIVWSASAIDSTQRVTITPN